jgi:hypothetical protein
MGENVLSGKPRQVEACSDRQEPKCGLGKRAPTIAIEHGVELVL